MKMENLMVFENEIFGKVRTITNNENKVYFVAKDVAEVLGYKKPDAMYRRLSDKQKMNINPQSIEKYGFPQINGVKLEPNPNIKTMVLITEGGLYKAIIGSNIPEAERFTDWIVDEVIPSIRKNEGYIRNQETMSSEELLAKADLMTQKIIAEKDSKIQQLEPQAQNYKLLMDTKGNIDFADFVKVTKLSEGRNTFMGRLRREKILMKNSTTPRQNYIERGYFEVVQGIATNGHSIVKTTITKKGQDWLIKKCNQWKLIANDLQQVN
jgi:prophage antirepressor-like protein